MSNWNIPQQKEVRTDLVDHAAAQELLLATYIEEQDRWNKNMLDVEGQLVKINTELKQLRNQQDKWWESLVQKLFKHTPKRQLRVNELSNLVIQLNDKYLNLIINMPKIDVYEFAMYGKKMFKIPT